MFWGSELIQSFPLLYSLFPRCHYWLLNYWIHYWIWYQYSLLIAYLSDTIGFNCGQVQRPFPWENDTILEVEFSSHCLFANRFRFIVCCLKENSLKIMNFGFRLVGFSNWKPFHGEYVAVLTLSTTWGMFLNKLCIWLDLTNPMRGQVLFILRAQIHSTDIFWGPTMCLSLC